MTLCRLQLSEGFFTDAGNSMGPDVPEQIRPLVHNLFVSELRSTGYPCMIEPYVVYATQEQLLRLGKRDLVLYLEEMHVGPCGPAMGIERSLGPLKQPEAALLRFLADGRLLNSANPAGQILLPLPNRKRK